MTIVLAITTGLLSLTTLLFFFLWRMKKDEAQRIQQSRNEMESGFQSLAMQVLNQQSEAFLKLASERLDRKTVEAKGVFDEKTTAIQKLVEPIEKTLSQVQNNLSEFERRRVEQFGQLSEQIKNVAKSSETLQRETQVLSSALKKPEVRGSWGEMQLRRLMEIAGMSGHCDFEEQVSISSERGALRPDVVVHLPNKRILVVDSKVVLTSFLDYLEANDEETKQRARLKHLANIKAKIRELSQKSYWDQFPESPEFAIMFIPNEAALHIAIEDDREILESAWKEKVIISSPTNLIALMKAVAYGWQQQEVAENAQKIFESTQELFERLIVWLDHFKKSGSRLSESVASYNQSVASLESRVLPSIKRINQFGTSQKELPEINFVETQVRDLKSLQESKTLDSEIGPK